MPRDKTTDGIAAICLATGLAALEQGESGQIVLAGPGFAIGIRDDAWEKETGRDFRTCTLPEYLRWASFMKAVEAISESVGQASLDAYMDYAALLQLLDGADMSGNVLLRPMANAWPDAMMPHVPWAASPDGRVDPYERIFPALDLLGLDAVVFCHGDPGIGPWCAENPQGLAMSVTDDGGEVYYGWNQELNRMASVQAPVVDFRKPWRAVRQPDGSEIIASATPLRLAAPILNCYEPEA